MKKTILLVEDDFLNRRLTKKTLAENGYAVLEAKNANEALQILRKELVDVVVLDIHLGENEQDGISLGEEIKSRYTLPFIYLTAYDNSEVIGRAVATAPFSYLTKPFKNVDLITAVEITIRQSAVKHIPRISVRDEEYILELPVDEIDFIESDGNYLLFHTNGKTYKSRFTIKQVLDELSGNIFVQVHRAFVINKTKVERFNQKYVIIRGKEIPVSRHYMEHVII